MYTAGMRYDHRLSGLFKTVRQKHLAEKEQLSTPMSRSGSSCILCFEKAREGKKVSLICSGDAGVYGGIFDV